MDDISAINEITKLDVAKGKRTFRRGRITHWKGQLDDYIAKPLSAINTTELDELKQDLYREVKYHVALQNRYELLLEEKDISEAELTDELTTSEKVKDSHRRYIRQIDALKTRHQYYQDALMIDNEYDTFIETSDPSIPEFEKEVNRVQKRLSTFIQQTLALAEDEDLQPIRKKMKDHLTHVTKTLTESRKKRAEARKKPSAETDKDKSEHTSYHERFRFDLDLPNFSGKPLDWRPFFDLFSSTLKSRGKHLTDNEKTCLLLNAMKDEEAYQVVFLHSQGEGGYEKAIQALVNNYGSPSIVYPHHVRRTTVRQSIDFTRDGLTKLRQRFLLPYQAMKDMKAATLSQYLMALAFEDFNPRMREEWTKHIASMAELPTLENLFAFTEPLEYKMTKVESTSTTSAASTNKSSTVHRKSNSVNPNSASKSMNRSQCNLCHEQHGLHKCPMFLSYDVSKRIKYIKDRKWCTNCLHHSHTCGNCSSTFTCKHCKQRHHTLLHKEDSDKNSTPSSNGVAVTSATADSVTKEGVTDPPTLAFLYTALVDATNGSRSCRARIALDTGASSSLITESLASHLKLKRYPKRLIIEGAYGGGTSRHYVQVRLQSVHEPEKSVILTLSVVPKLPTAYPPVRKDDIATDPHLKDLQLADPEFGGPLHRLQLSLNPKDSP